MAPKTVIILESDQKERVIICEALEREGFETVEASSFSYLVAHLDKSSTLAAIFDIDKSGVDSRTIRKLTIKHPGVFFFGLSAKRFHPDLKDAICYHMYACLKKPVDPNEVVYFISSAYSDSSSKSNKNNC